MSNMKCPFCQQELRNCCAGVIYTCSKPDSCPHEQCYGSKELWQELIRTRKALDVAVDAIDAGRTLARIAGFEMLATGMDDALEQITALDQKDTK